MKKFFNLIVNIMISLAISFLYLLIFVHLFEISVPVAWLLTSTLFILIWQYFAYEAKLLHTRRINKIIAFNFLSISVLGIVNHIFQFFWLDWLIIFSYPLLIVSSLLFLTAKLGIKEMQKRFIDLSLAILVIALSRVFPISIYNSYLIGATAFYLLIYYKYHKINGEKVAQRSAEIAFVLLVVGIIGSLIHLINGLMYEWQIIFSYPLIIVAVVIGVPGMFLLAPVEVENKI